MVLRAGRIAAGVSLGLLMGLTGFSSAEAASANPPSTDGFQHFLDCFGAMLHDGATHQQYCSPGSNVPSNNSLGSFSGGALVCHHYYEGALTQPLFGSYDLASIGDWTDAAPSNAPVRQQWAGSIGTCYCGYWSEATPLFAPVQVASLDPEIGLPMLSGVPQKHPMMTAC